VSVSAAVTTDDRQPSLSRSLLLASDDVSARLAAADVGWRRLERRLRALCFFLSERRHRQLVRRQTVSRQVPAQFVALHSLSSFAIKTRFILIVLLYLSLNCCLVTRHRIHLLIRLLYTHTVFVRHSLFPTSLTTSSDPKRLLPHFFDFASRLDYQGRLVLPAVPRSLTDPSLLGDWFIIAKQASSALPVEGVGLVPLSLSLSLSHHRHQISLLATLFPLTFPNNHKQVNPQLDLFTNT
jgi:hypothetical protein